MQQQEWRLRIGPRDTEDVGRVVIEIGRNRNGETPGKTIAGSGGVERQDLQKQKPSGGRKSGQHQSQSVQHRLG